MHKGDLQHIHYDCGKDLENFDEEIISNQFLCWEFCITDCVLVALMFVSYVLLRGGITPPTRFLAIINIHTSPLQ